MISFTVRGIPAPQGSKRLLPRGARRGGAPILVESSKRVPKWRRAVRDEARRAIEALPVDEQRPRAGAVSIRIEFRMPRPAGHYLPANSRRAAPELRDDAPLRPTGKPDLDKLARAVLDALTGLVWADDSQVVGVEASKVYVADHRPQPGAEIRVTDLAAMDEAVGRFRAEVDRALYVDGWFGQPIVPTPPPQED